MRYLILGIFIIITQSVFSQSDSTYNGYKGSNADATRGDFWDKVYAGGDLMLYGGSGGFYFNLSPMIGYRPGNKSFSYGIGATYQYTGINDPFYGSLSYSLYGVRGFLRQQLGRFFFLHAEAENYFTEGINVITGQEELISIPCANAFIGYKQSFSEYSYYYLMVGYDFIQDPKAIYAYPLTPVVFKVGYIFDIRGK